MLTLPKPISEQPNSDVFIQVVYINTLTRVSLSYVNAEENSTE